MGCLNAKLQLITNVLAIRQYAVIAVCTGSALGVLYYYITMAMLATHFDAAVQAMPLHIVATLGLTVVISVLAGINFAMVAFKIHRMRMTNSVKSNSSAVLGGAFAAFTPGCPACTAPLAVILGAVGGLSVFPMQGLELKFLSVGVLVFSVWWIARGIERDKNNGSCCRIE